MAFSCNCFDQIMKNGGQEMLDELYKDSQLPHEKYLPNMDITLGIKVAESGKTQSKSQFILLRHFSC